MFTSVPMHPRQSELNTKTIHQIWLQGKQHLQKNRPDFYAYVAACRRLHNDNHFLWSEEEIKSLIDHEYPQLAETFASYPHFILRVDLAKYIILHHYGGFYVDADTKCLRSCESLMDLSEEWGSKPLVAEVRNDPRTKFYSVVKFEKRFINNHFFYFPQRKHPLLANMLARAPTCAKRHMLQSFAMYVLSAIGPGFVMKCMYEYKKELQQKYPHVQVKAASIVTIVDSKYIDTVFRHESQSTWLEQYKLHWLLQMTRPKNQRKSKSPSPELAF